MTSNLKKLTAGAIFATALYSLITYAFAHLAYMYMNTDTGLIFELISLYISKITAFIIPAALFALTLTVYASSGLRRSVLFALSVSSARVLYTLPYYYIIFIYNYGYDSAEAILLSLIASAAVIVFTVIEIYAALVIACALLRKKESGVKSLLAESLNERQPVGDFTKGANLALLISSLLSLISALIPEIVDTVSFFSDYGLDYTAAEILTIMCNYLLLLIMVFAGYILSVYIKNKVIKETDGITAEP